VYWFRYTCILILSAKTSRDYALEVAVANRLSFVETRVQLADQATSDAQANDLDELYKLLHRDYVFVTYLLRHAGRTGNQGHSVENQIVMVDYKIMRLWYSLVRTASPVQARQALLEMTSIVNYLANSMGERVAIGISS
jgi:hypothetical protein